MTEAVVTVEYFAVLREMAGIDEDKIALSACAAPSPAALYDYLANRYHFSLPREDLRVAINEEFAAMDTPLSGGERVVFIPPVAGG